MKVITVPMIDFLSILFIYRSHLEGELILGRTQKVIDVVSHWILVEVPLHCFLETEELGLFVFNFLLDEI